MPSLSGCPIIGEDALLSCPDHAQGQTLHVQDLPGTNVIKPFYAVIEDPRANFVCGTLSSPSTIFLIAHIAPSIQTVGLLFKNPCQ
jgi:hypothetical protein